MDQQNMRYNNNKGKKRNILRYFGKKNNKNYQKNKKKYYQTYNKDINVI